jgi:hypothetical protein
MGNKVLYAMWKPKITFLPEGTDGTAGNAWIYAEFGMWPQTRKADEITVDENITRDTGAYIYYQGSDGAWYAKVSENPYDLNYTYSDGTRVSDGESAYFKVEPIKWRVLTDHYRYSGETFLLAEKILMADVSYYPDNKSRRLGQDVYPNNYEYSAVRAWLNGIEYPDADGRFDNRFVEKGFLQTAFNEDEQELIFDKMYYEDYQVNTEEGIQYFNYSIYNKIILLSENDATDISYGFLESDAEECHARIREVTDFAIANHAEKSSAEGYGGKWALRTPNVNTNTEEKIVTETGTISSETTMSTNTGIVPSLTLYIF